MDLMAEYSNFPLTRALMKVVNAFSPGASNHVLFRWNSPGSALDCSLNGPQVAEEALEELGRRARESMEGEDSWLHDLPSKPRFQSDTHLTFRDTTAEKVKKCFSNDFISPAVDQAVAKIWEDDGEVHLDLRPALRIGRADLAPAQQRLLRQRRANAAFIAEKELLISRSGWVLHAVRLAEFYGLTKGSREIVNASCGSLVQHVMHAETCGNELALDEDQRRRLLTLVQGARTMCTKHTDEVLLAVFWLWHLARDAWADGKLQVGGRARRLQGQRRLFVGDDELLAMLGADDSTTAWKHAQAERYLLPLFVLSRMSVEPKTVEFGQPPLRSAIDCLDPVSDEALQQWIGDIPRAERRGFVISVSEGLRRWSLPTFMPEGGARVWGRPAIDVAKREVARRRRNGEEEDGDEDLVDRLTEQWRATGPGYFYYPVLLSMAAMTRRWPPSVRRLARVLMSNLDGRDKSPLWFDRGYAKRRAGYWARKVPGQKGRYDWYFPALGVAKSAWKAESWVGAGCYVANSSGRRQMLEDFEFLGDELKLVVSVPGRGSGRAVMSDLKALARNRGWANVRMEPLLPLDFLDELAEQLDEREGPAEPEPRRTWTPGRIRRTLRKRDRSQSWLAEQVGCSKSMVSQLLSGVKPVSDIMDQRLTAALKSSKLTVKAASFSES